MYSIFKEKKKTSIASHLEFYVERFSPIASSFVSTAWEEMAFLPTK